MSAPPSRARRLSDPVAAVGRQLPISEAVSQWAESFAAADSALMAKRELQKRVDTKFIVDVNLLPQILSGITTQYAALRVPAGNIARYLSVYFDSVDLQCFHDHRRGRRLRQKIRIRHYPDRLLSFLEIKTKRNEVVTDKARIALTYGTSELAHCQDFLATCTPFKIADLHHVLDNDFGRLSLVSLNSTERVTIDVGIRVAPSHHSPLLTVARAAPDLSSVAIIEVKQNSFSSNSAIVQALGDSGAREQSFSKYAIGMAMLYPSLRRNRMLPDIRAIERRL
jgi:hypothetical protein